GGRKPPTSRMGGWAFLTERVPRRSNNFRGGRRGGSWRTSRPIRREGNVMARLRNLDYKWLVAAVFVSGLFMDLLDTTIVNVALPTLGKEFNAANTTLEWVVTGYLLSLAVWIPASGWLGDRFGTKRIFLLALFLFTLGSALCGESWSIGSLI